MGPRGRDLVGAAPLGPLDGRLGRLGMSGLLVLGIAAGAVAVGGMGGIGATAAGAATSTGSPGHIFAVNAGNGTVTSYPLTATGNASPSSTVQGIRPSIDRPWMTAFDGAGDLWLANCQADTVVELTPAELATSGAPTPAVTLRSDGSGSLSCPEGLAFDPAGDLWVGNVGTFSLTTGAPGTVVELTPSQLASSGSPTPAVTLSAPTPATTTILAGPYALAFDATGNLWVANYTSSTLDAYTPSQQAAGGAPNPAVVITSTGTPGTTTASLSGPTGLAFDGAGDLWVTNYNGDTVTELAAATLAATGSPAPAAQITSVPVGPTGPTTLSAPVDLAFDGTGNLWVTNAFADTVVGYWPTQLVGGAQVPAVILSATTATPPSLAGPAGLAMATGGGFWVANRGNSTLVRYTATQMATSGSPTPAVTIVATTPPSLAAPYGAAFDPSGDLWVTQCTGPGTTGSALEEYTPGQLAASGTAEPAARLLPASATTALACPYGAAFDRSGDLWVANYSSRTLVEYTPAQLAAGGRQTPATVVGSPGFDSPGDVAFDRSGDLWVGNLGGTTVVELTPDQLAAGGVQAPAVTIGQPAGGTPTVLATPTGLAFDGAGDLWVASATNDTVAEYAPSQLGASGNPTPSVVLSSAGGTLAGPVGLAFDGSGNLWVANSAGPSLVTFTPDQMTASGSPVPAATITGTATGLAAPAGLAVAPAPTVTSVSPTGGPAAGGTTVTVTGTQFTDGATVAFGGTPATSVTVAGPTSLTAVAPAGSGTVDVTVTTLGGTSATSAGDRFTYAAATTGYWEVADDGGIFAFGTAPFYGSMGGQHLDKPVIGMAATPDAHGYWEVATDGGIFAFGDAPFYGSMGGKALNKPVVNMAATPDGKGYWEVATDGGVFAFGDAAFYGSMAGRPLNKPVVGIASTPDGNGYWEVADDGGIFAFGDAAFYGSMGGQSLNKPVVGIAATPDGNGSASDGAASGGYWEVATDGGIFAFGDAAFYGSMAGRPLDKPVAHMAATATGTGYWEVATDGGIFAFGTAAFEGSMAGRPLNAPVVGMAAS
ncbi:MAG TPA: IPT/TIG domain-containing protein [Acidimicrobiales bacterium]|nr:IPT/TIG domain-containing protein [Acidimicrobiales bacterium]